MTTKPRKPHGPSRICEQQGCGHFRSVHRGGAACAACDCETFVFTTTPTKPKRPLRRFTNEECEGILARLNEGVSYTDVAREFGRKYETVRKKFPGYGGNTDQEVMHEHRERMKDAWNRGNKAHAVRVALREADRKHGFICPCGTRAYAFGLCYRCYTRMRRAKEFGQP